MKKKLNIQSGKEKSIEKIRRTKQKYYQKILTQDLKNEILANEIYSCIHDDDLKTKAEQGDPISQYYYGRSFILAYDELRPNNSQAVYWITKAAEQGDFDAQLELAVMYANAENTFHDYEKAAYWYTKVADEGSKHARYELGLLYYNGQGVAKNYSEALRLFKSAADQGDIDALNYLGMMHEKGQGVIKDYKKAIDLYTEAAEQGSMDAQFNMGLLYYRDESAPPNYCLSYAWISLVAEHGDEEAMELRDEIEEKLTSRQLAEALSIVTNLKKRILNLSR
jgi:uncharacterized protein